MAVGLRKKDRKRDEFARPDRGVPRNPAPSRAHAIRCDEEAVRALATVPEPVTPLPMPVA
jgi:hypothetical protein